MVYQIEDKPPISKIILFAFQGVFSAVASIIAVPLLVCQAVGFDQHTCSILISATILASGIASIIQSTKIGPIGSKTPCLMGVSFNFIVPATTIGKAFGMAGILGASLFTGIFEFILGFFVKPLMKLFPPIVTGTVITLIGLTLIPNSIDWLAGGSGNPNYGNPWYIALGIFVMAVILFCHHFFKNGIKGASVLIGLAVGFLISIPFGLVDFTSVEQDAWFALPNVLQYGMSFHLESLFAVVPVCFVLVIETVGCLQGIGEASNTEIDSKRMRAGVFANGAGAAIGSFLGAFPSTTFAQNISLVSVTRAASRYITAAGGVILVLLGLFPKFAGIINAIPDPVLGGAGVILFGMVASEGIRSLSKIKMNERNLMILAVSFTMGLGVTFYPEFLSGFPSFIQMIFCSGISTGAIVAIILNLVLREKKEETKEEKEA